MRVGAGRFRGLWLLELKKTGAVLNRAVLPAV